MERVLLVRYGEIGLKGQNRSYFEDTLCRNIELALANMTCSKGNAKVEKSQGRLYVIGINHEDEQAYVDAISKVPGVVGVSVAVVVENEMEKIEQAALSLMKDAMPTFKVNTKRPNKDFPVTSPEMNQRIGDAVLRSIPGVSVNLHNPDTVLHIEIRSKKTYLYVNEEPGPGGLPVGVSGRGTVLISGGIDSPVSAYMAMKRGVEINALHFWSYPITGERSRDKVVDICKALAQFNPNLRLYVAPFTEIQTRIIEDCPENYRVTTMRRMMMRIATEFCKKTGSQAIFTGENLGQVASQTLESLTVIEEAAGFPVLRPLICFDKTEIIDTARSIGTYDISCLPYEDCCSIFVPRHPVTRPTMAGAISAERKLNVGDLVSQCVLGIEEASLNTNI